MINVVNCIELHPPAQKEDSFYFAVDFACYIHWAGLLHSDDIWVVVDV